MSELNKKIGFAGLTLFMVFLAWSLSPHPDVEISVRQQVKNDIQLALRHNRDAKTYAEWRTSGYTPEDIFRNIEALHTPEATAQLCEELIALDPSHLALFEDEIQGRAAVLADARECSREGTRDLLRRIQAHWKTIREEFHSSHGLAASDASGDSGIKNPVDISLASAETPINTSKTRIFGKNSLKAGEVALVFDDGPHPTRTENILNTLSRAGVRAHFFAVGEKARRNQALIRRAAEEKHTVGSQTLSHSNLSLLSLREAQREITEGRDAVHLSTGLAAPFFRFPYDLSSEFLEQFLAKNKLVRISWDIDSADYRVRNPEELLRNALRQLDAKKGGVILLHDRFEQTAIFLPVLLRSLRDRNYKTLVFVPELPPAKNALGHPKIGTVKRFKPIAANPAPPDRHPLNIEH